MFGCDGLEPASESDDSYSDTDEAPDVADVVLGGACSPSERFGGFLVEIYEQYSIVDGSVADGVVPISILEEVGATDQCRLLRRNNPFCDPACGPNLTCDFDGTCIPYPLNQDLGTVTVSGLSAPVEMEPLQPGNSYFDTSLPHPAFAPGALVTVQTSGGAHEPIRLYGVGVEPLTVLDDVWVVSGKDLEVSWATPVADVVRSEIALRFNIDQHGATPVSVDCRFDDVGQAVVPAAILEALMGFGVSGFPNGKMTRRTLDQTALGSGCVEFEVGAPVPVDVRVEGFIPCDDPSDCPDDMSCNLEVGLCE